MKGHQIIKLIKRNYFILLMFSVTLGTGCYYDVEEELYPNGNCDTTQVKYTTTIRGLLNNYGCMGCHVGGSASGGIFLENYIQVKASVSNGKLWGAINHLPGFSPMPQGANKMNSCDINKFKAWIDSGAPDN